MLIDLLYGKIILAAFMLVCAVIDFKRLEIHWAVFAGMMLMIIAGYVWMLMNGYTVLWLRIVNGLVVAAAVWIISFITKQQIGYGDAAYFTITATVLGCVNLLLLAGGLLVCSLIGIIILVCEKLKGRSIKNKRLPFLTIIFPVGIAVMFL